MTSGIKVDKDAVDTYLKLQKNKLHRWVVLRFNDDNTLVVTKAFGDENSTFDDMMQHIDKTSAQFCAYDCRYDTISGQPRDKVILFLFADDDECNRKQKMIAATTFMEVQKSCPKYQKHTTINEYSELTEDFLVNIVSENKTK